MNPPPPPPRYSRATLLSACSVLKALTHSEFDRFLLEIGIEEIDAGQNRGGLLGRTNALGGFVLGNLDAKTAEGRPLLETIVEKAVAIDHAYPHGGLKGVTDGERKSFWDSLAKDGNAEGSKPKAEPRKDPFVDVYAQHFGSMLKPASRSEKAVGSNKVFLVHGRDGAARESVENYLRKLKLDPIVLHDRPNKGRTLITKFREEAEGSNFAVVLITPDDEGGVKGSETMEPRGRQNVIFELGFFIGKLGPENVCALLLEGVERPSDIEGVVYVPFGQNTNWRNQLARELREAQIPFDHSQVF